MNFVNVPVARPNGYNGHVAVDLHISNNGPREENGVNKHGVNGGIYVGTDGKFYPGFEIDTDGNAYPSFGDNMPCSGGQDWFYPACATAKADRSAGNTYYKSLDFTSDGNPKFNARTNELKTNQLTLGIFIDNQNTPDPRNFGPSRPLVHEWAKRLTGLSLEFYLAAPGKLDDETTTGGLRVDIPNEYFDNYVWNGVFSRTVEFNVPPPDNMVTMAGFATYNEGGVVRRTPDFQIEHFQLSGGTPFFKNDPQGPKAASFDSIRTNKEWWEVGYYKTGPMLPGCYEIFLTHCPGAKDECFTHFEKPGGKAILFIPDVTSKAGRLDYRMEAGAGTCFGQATINRWCVQCTDVNCSNVKAENLPPWLRQQCGI